MLHRPGVLLHRQITKVHPNSVWLDAGKYCAFRSQPSNCLSDVSTVQTQTSSTSCGLKTKSQESQLRCLKRNVLSLNSRRWTTVVVHRRLPSAAYSVALTRRLPTPVLGESRSDAAKRFQQNERSLHWRDKWQTFADILQNTAL